MSLPHALLGFLTSHPMTGYDLKKAFDRSVRHFWQADQAQIYRTLTKLVDNGWVAVKHVEQRDRPNQKVHTLAKPGGVELKRWLRERLPVPDIREATLIQLFFADRLSDAGAEEVLHGQCEALRATLGQLEALSSPRNAEGGKPAARQRFFSTKLRSKTASKGKARTVCG